MTKQKKNTKSQSAIPAVHQMAGSHSQIPASSAPQARNNNLTDVATNGPGTSNSFDPNRHRRRTAAPLKIPRPRSPYNLRSLKNLISGKFGWELSDFNNAVCLQETDNSIVVKADSKITRKTLAFKFLKHRIKDLLEHTLQKEAKHDNIVRHFGAFVSGSLPVFVMDYFSRGDLHDLIHGQGAVQLQEEKAQLYIRQIISGTRYIQSILGYIHKDLKPENIFVANDNCVKVGDLGSVVKMKTLRFIHNCTPRGTLPYCSSEELQSGIFDSTADVWAIGCIAFELLNRSKPFMVSVDDGKMAMLQRMLAFQNRIMQSHGLAHIETVYPNAYTFIQKSFAARLERPVLSALARLAWVKEKP